MPTSGQTRRRRRSATFADLRERDDERAAIEAALGRALDRSGAALAFEAPAGVGKTALLSATAEHARGLAATILIAHGVELEQGLAAGIAGQLFLPVLLDAGDSERAELLAGPAALAAPALGLEPPAAGVDPVAAGLHGLYWLCVNLADRGPLVLAVDDAHWADEASVRFLAHLAPRLAGLPLLLLVAARPAESGARRAALDGLLADPAIEVLRPAPLSSSATAMVVRERAGADAPDELCRACHVVSGGNPFLLDELLQGLASELADPATADAAVVEAMGSESVARSVLVRLGRLRSEAGRVAIAVAIFPGGAEFRHVAALSELDDADTARCIDELVELAILAPGRPLTFLHPMMRTAVYEDLGSSLRALMHLRAACLLRADGASATDVASHLLATEAGTDPEAFGELLDAAGAAMAAGAPEAAIRYLDRALEEPLGSDEMAAALHLRGVARMLSADPAAVADLRAAAERAPAGEPRAAALQDLARFLGFALENAEAIALLDAATAEAGAGSRRGRSCRLDRTWISFAHDEFAPRFVEEMRALRAPHRPSGLFDLAACALRAHWLAWSCEDAEEVVRLATIGLGDEVLHAGFDGFPAVAYGSVALYLADRPAEALSALDRALGAARRSGAVRDVGLMHLLAALPRLYAGELADAESDIELAIDYSPHPPGVGMVGGYVLGMRAIVALERAGAAEAAAVLGDFEPAPNVGGMALLAARGRIHLALGRADEALADLDAAVTAAHLRGLFNPMYLFNWGGYRTLAAAAAGQHEQAHMLADEDLRRGRQFGAAGVLGSALRVAGLVRGGEHGLALLREAADVLSGSRARLLRAQALVDLGSALRRAGHRADAREPLHHAVDLARRCGADPLAERATEELRQTGGRMRREYVSGVEALTPAELRVVRMAAEGMTNRAIAQQLFLTVKTVESHIANAFKKLGVGARGELASALGADRAASH